MKRTFLSEFIYATKQVPRVYFAPLVGAVRGAINETREAWRQVDAQNAERNAMFKAEEQRNTKQKQT